MFIRMKKMANRQLLKGEHENITVVEQPLAELAADAAGGRIADGKLLTLFLALRLRRPDLFADPA